MNSTVSGKTVIFSSKEWTVPAGETGIDIIVTDDKGQEIFYSFYIEGT